MTTGFLSFEDYFNQPLKDRLKHYERDGRPFHMMVSQQFTRDFLETLFDSADLVKHITKKPIT